MLVSHLKKFIYFKTNAKAALAVEYHFEKYCMPVDTWAEYSEIAREVHFSEAGIIGKRGLVTLPSDSLWIGLQPAEKMHFQLGEETWASYKKFGVVQNPYDKAIAAFYREKTRSGTAPQSLEVDRNDFEIWLIAGGYSNDTPFITVDDTTCLFDICIRYETLEQDMIALCETLGVAYSPDDLNHFRHNLEPAGVIASTFYTDATKAIVTEKAALELDLFNYTFPAD